MGARRGASDGRGGGPGLETSNRSAPPGVGRGLGAEAKEWGEGWGWEGKRFQEHT